MDKNNTVKSKPNGEESSNKGNLTKAVNGLFGLDLGKKGKVQSPVTPAEQIQKEDGMKQTAVKSKLQVLPTSSSADVKRDSFITEDTVIEGEIRTGSSIIVAGTVRGAVISESDILITGKIYGNIRGKSIIIKNGLVEGNIYVRSEVSLAGESIVLGDIESEKFVSEGKVKGNVKAHSSATLNNAAVLLGNLDTKTISVQPGVIINGYVKITTDVTLDELFQDVSVKTTLPVKDLE